MRLKDVFISETIDDTKIMVSMDSSVMNGMLRANPTAAFIVDCLKEDTTKEQILDSMREKFDGPEDLMKEDIEMVIEKLKGINAIIDEIQ